MTSIARLDNLEALAEKYSDDVVFLDSYVKINFVGFRKITKKYDKHNNSSASCWYLSRLVKEKFVNLNFDFLIELINLCYGELRSVRRQLVGGVRHSQPRTSSGDESTNGYVRSQGQNENMAESDEDDADEGIGPTTGTL